MKISHNLYFAIIALTSCLITKHQKSPEIRHKNKHMVTLIKDAINFVCFCDLRFSNKSALNKNFIAVWCVQQ